VSQELPVSQEQLVLKVQPVPLANLAPSEKRALLVQQDTLVKPVLKVLKGKQVLLALRVTMERLVEQDLLVHLGWKAQLDLKVQPVPKVKLVLLEAQERQALKVQLVLLDTTEELVLKVKLVKLDQLALKAQQVLKELLERRVKMVILVIQEQWVPLEL
jgi:hypothetical protein